MTITRFDKQAQIERLWEALECYRENSISGSEHDLEWDELCTIMAWITEDLEAQMSAKDKYSAYCYWSAKQGLTPLSFNAWNSTVKQGRVY